MQTVAWNCKPLARRMRLPKVQKWPRHELACAPRLQIRGLQDKATPLQVSLQQLPSYRCFGRSPRPLKLQPHFLPSSVKNSQRIPLCSENGVIVRSH